MRQREWSWRVVHQNYESLRRRYFMDAEPPLRVPPPASVLRWSWLSELSPDLGATHLDEDGDPESLELNPWLRRSSRHLRAILIHEMVHMRDPKISCRVGSRRWTEETVRLATLGAPIL